MGTWLGKTCKFAISAFVVTATSYLPLAGEMLYI